MPTRPDHMLLSDGAAESISNAIEYADPLAAVLGILVDSDNLPPAASFPVRAALHLVEAAKKDMHKALEACGVTKTEPPPNVAWGWSASSEPEAWSGHCATREEAIAKGSVELMLPRFFICSGRVPRASELVRRFGSDIEDHMADAADDLAGEAGADSIDVPKGAKAKLEELIARWADQNVPIEFWVADGTPEEIKSELPILHVTDVAPDHEDYGRATTLAEFLRDNAEDAGTCAQVEALGVGERVELHGGAGCKVIVERVS